VRWFDRPIPLRWQRLVSAWQKLFLGVWLAEADCLSVWYSVAVPPRAVRQFVVGETAATLSLLGISSAD